jgi:glutamyl-tRNA reductase
LTRERRRVDSGDDASSHPDEFSCEFVDCSIMSDRQIGELYEEVRGQGLPSVSPGSAFLTTCQRVEVYRCGTVPFDTLPHPRPDLSRTVVGRHRVSARLAEIASGVRSQVLGEHFILVQVRAMLSGMPDDHPLRPLIMEAVDVARHVRSTLGFQAVLDYPDLVLRLLDAHADSESETIVVGSGLLAQGVVLTLAKEAVPVRGIVTRSPKRLRKKLRQAGIKRPSCVTPNDVVTILDEAVPFNVVIATSNVDPQYRMMIQRIALNEGCALALDLSSVPILNAFLRRGPTTVMTLYDDTVRAMIAAQNEGLAVRLPAVKRAIRQSLNQPRVSTSHDRFDVRK